MGRVLCTTERYDLRKGCGEMAGRDQLLARHCHVVGSCDDSGSPFRTSTVGDFERVYHQGIEDGCRDERGGLGRGDERRTRRTL